MDKYIKNSKVFIDGKLRYEIIFLIVILLFFILNKYRLQNKISHNKPSFLVLNYLENNNRHVLVTNDSVSGFISKGWKKKYSFAVFKGRVLDSTKFIVYTLSDNLIIVKEGETVPIDAQRQLEFFAFSSLEDVSIPTTPIVIGYIKEDNKFRSIICMTDDECDKCDKTQTIHIPSI